MAFVVNKVSYNEGTSDGEGPWKSFDSKEAAERWAATDVIEWHKNLKYAWNEPYFPVIYKICHLTDNRSCWDVDTPLIAQYFPQEVEQIKRNGGHRFAEYNIERFPCTAEYLHLTKGRPLPPGHKPSKALNDNNLAVVTKQYNTEWFGWELTICGERGPVSDATRDKFNAIKRHVLNQ